MFDSMRTVATVRFQERMWRLAGGWRPRVSRTHLDQSLASRFCVNTGRSHAAHLPNTFGIAYPLRFENTTGVNRIPVRRNYDFAVLAVLRGMPILDRRCCGMDVVLENLEFLKRRKKRLDSCSADNRTLPLICH